MNKILVFDAYPSIRELLAEELTSKGNTVVTIGNPDMVLGLINTFAPDLLILDPYIRGKMMWEVFDLIKGQSPKLPILLFTEWPAPDPHFEKADASLTKSYILDRLNRKIKEIMERKSSGKNGSSHLSLHKSKGAAL